MRGECMQPLSAHSRLVVQYSDETTTLAFRDGARMLQRFNQLLARYDPDLILSERGDAVLFPALLKLAQQENISLQLDRDLLRTQRKIKTEGRTYFS